MAPIKTLLSSLRDLIAKDRLDDALQQLRTLLDNTPQLDEALLQSARWNDIRKQIRLGIVSHEDAMLTKDQIKKGLLDFLREIEEQGEKPGIREEVEQAILDQKVIIQNAEKIYNIGKIDNANFS